MFFWARARHPTTSALRRGDGLNYEPQDDATEQAEFFLETVGKLGPGDLPPALDLELGRDVDAETMLRGVQVWLDLVEKATGRRPVIYTGYKFWDSLGSDAFGGYPLWLAEYGTTDPVLPAGWSEWTFWQFEEAATVAGVDKEVDLDWYAGSLEDLLALAGLFESRSATLGALPHSVAAAQHGTSTRLTAACASSLPAPQRSFGAPVRPSRRAVSSSRSRI